MTTEKTQHARDSAELRRLCSERDQLREKVAELEGGNAALRLVRDDYKWQADEYRAKWARATLKVQPSGVVRWPEADEIMQMAFEEGQPSEDASGYYFELEEFDLFIQRLMEEVARLNQPASAGDEPIRYWFIGDVGQEAGQRHCKKSSHDGSLALFESESDAKRAVRRHPGTEVYLVEYYLKPQARAALSAPSHGEQVWEVVPDLANLKADSARYQFLKENCQQDVDGYRNETPVLVHALSHVSDWRGRIDESIDAAISASPSAGSQKEQG